MHVIFVVVDIRLKLWFIGLYILLIVEGRDQRTILSGLIEC